MQIGEVSKRSGVPAATIRYYEAEKLISRASRTRSGYRHYSARILTELAFIKQAQRLGFSLGEIREILNIGRGGKKPCGHVAALCDAHLRAIDQRMAELRSFRRNLKATRQLAESDCGFDPEGFCKAIMAADQDH
jgi:MerR family transcriptional regulator, copper efflux regulator